jgi:geranylgeranyl pyrophosphate synthase
VSAAARAVLAAGGEQVAERARAVDQLVAQLVSLIPGAAGARAAAVVDAGGKRLRPLLALLVAGDGPGPGSAEERSLLVSAAAVELVHVATLVHDDVLDRAPLRRGLATIWAQDGAEAAVGSGDALLAAAFRAVADEAQAPVAGVLATAASSLAAGELMQRADAYRLDVTPERYELRVIGKTAALFEAACRIGGLHGDVPEEEAGAIGRDLGVAFQLLDDLLDIEGDPAVTGKARGTDLLDGTVTLPFILARERDPSLRDVGRVETPEAAEALCDRIAATGALEEARNRALAIVADAKAGLPYRDEALDLVADGVVERYS